ncbi:PD-(D/E)XK nuclease family protein [Planctomycetota bacterium]
MLRWLETQLGLPVPAVHPASRITEYAAVLDTVTDSVITASMQTDRWATASALLSRRDELLLAGWDETDSDRLPAIVRDLAKAAEGHAFVFPSEAGRLRRVLDALNAGQVLPTHSCVLHDPPEVWPLVWRQVIARLNVVDSPEFAPHGPQDSALYKAQSAILGGTPEQIEQDATFRYVHTRSQSTAVEFVTAALAETPDKLSDTVIYCEDSDLALRLDACLARAGLPTTGASASSRAHPVLQVLPLTLALCWEPVDPQALLDFLTLPVVPLPRAAASRLAQALAKEPGLGSRAWQAALEDLCSRENDPEGRLRERLDAWLYGERVPRGSDIPVRLVRLRSSMVAQWASARVSLLTQNEHTQPELIEAWQIAAGQASLLGELAESQGAALSEPQLAHLMEEVVADGVKAAPFLEAQGGPVLVRCLAEIDAPFERLIWLGLGTEDPPACHWSTRQLRELRSAGIELDDGSKAITALRLAEACTCAYVREAFLAVSLPQDQEKKGHPIWLTVHGMLADNDLDQPLVIEDLIAAGDVSALEPFGFQRQDAPIEPPQPARPIWHIPADLLCDREMVSATELEERLACPLKWTLHYQAGLRPSPIAKLPEDYQLKGTFCHSIFQRVFGGGGQLPSVDEAVSRVLAAFDERLGLDAAPLAQPDKYLERQRLRGELEHVTQVFVETLVRGAYRIVGIEVELSGHAFGKPLKGWIDCVAARDNGDEAVIDFKYGGRSKYYKLIEEGRAVQLATYAYARSTQRGTFPAVAYLVLADGLLYTPSEGPIAGNAHGSVINAPAIQTVWQRFADVLDTADDWLSSGAPVPARPLQEPAQWPDGTAIVLETNLKADQKQDVCKYCDYQRLCGLQEST